jgi:ABC-type phosphate/phosphonate transport system substrate-binding protein
VLAYQKASAGAYLFQLYHLARNGVDPSRDLKSLRHNNSQDSIVLAVHAGRIHAGFVRSGIVEALALEGKINPDDLTIVDERHDELKYRHTTELYPERFLVVSANLDVGLRDRLQRAALALGPADPASRAAGIDGFVKPLNLDKIREAMRMLPVRPCHAASTNLSAC